MYFFNSLFQIIDFGMPMTKEDIKKQIKEIDNMNAKFEAEKRKKENIKKEELGKKDDEAETNPKEESEKVEEVENNYFHA